MYIPKHFSVEDREHPLNFIRDHGFATLVSQGVDGLMATHLPMLVDDAAQGGIFLSGHVARANPHWRYIESGSEVLVIFHGPHAYISPTWYEMHPSVPTWNYAVVHAHGRGRLIDSSATRRLLNRLTEQYESGRKKPWRMEDLNDEYVEKMLLAIVGFEITVDRFECKLKLSQNRPATDRAGVAKALLQGNPTEHAVAQLMQKVEKRS